MQEHHLPVQRTARYYTLGTPGDAVREVWIVCHGYGQLAKFFVRHFAAIDDGRTLIVAPEALSRFYLDSTGGRVGATWMTKEDRLAEIDDYLHYLDTLHEHIFRQIERSRVRLTLLGFSQSTATVCRWLSRGAARAERLVLWAGLMPPDLPLRSSDSPFHQTELFMVLGDGDEYARPEHVARQKRLLEEHNVAYQFISFPGGHHLDGEVLRRLRGS